MLPVKSFYIKELAKVHRLLKKCKYVCICLEAVSMYKIDGRRCTVVEFGQRKFEYFINYI